MSRRAALALLIALFMLPGTSAVANAAAVRWNNAAGGNWNVAANWSPAAIPGATDTAVVDLAGTYVVTVNQNVSIAGLRVSGSASGTQTLTATSRTLTFSGPVSFGAQAIVNWTSCTVNGAGAITNEGTYNLSASSVAQATSNAGLLIVTSTSSQVGTFTTIAGSTLRLTGTAAANAQYTVTNGFTNNAAIELTSSGAATAATLTVTNGTLTNAPGATITSLAGSGGGRNLTAQLDNQGTLTVSQALTTNKGSTDHVNTGTIDVTGGDYTIVLSATTPTFTTSGTINVASGRTLNLNGTISLGTGQNYNYAGGTFGGAGTIALSNSTLNLTSSLASSMAHLDGSASTIAGPGTLTVSNGTLVPLLSCNVTATTVVEAGGTLAMTASDQTGPLTTSGTTVWINACTAPGAITTVPGSVLRVQGVVSANSQLIVSNGFTNNSTIELTSLGAATAATLSVTSGILTNASGAQINSLVGSGGGRNLTARLDNQGLITVSQALATNKGGVAHTNSGTIDVTGANYTITLSAAPTSFTTTGTINVALGRTLNLNGNVTLGTNLNYNYAGGTLGGAGTVALSNSTLNLTASLASSMAHLDGNASTIAGPGTLTISNGTLVPLLSCNVTAPTVVEAGGTLEMTASDQTGPLSSSGTTVWINACTAPGAITTVAGSILRVQGIASVNSQLIVSNGFTNNSTIELTSLGAATAATLSVTNGILTNAPGAQISSLVGSGGGRNLTARLDNQGLITVSQALATNKGGVAHTNSGTIDVTGANYTITLSAAPTSFTTTGTINVASGRTLNLNGNVALGTNLNYNYAGGTFGGAGTIALSNSTLNLTASLASSMAHMDGSSSTIAGPGTLTVSNGTLVPLLSCNVTAPTVVEAGGTLEMTASDQTGPLSSSGTTVWINACTAPGAITTLPGSILRVQGTPAVNGSLVVSNGFTNNSTIELTSLGAATAATLSVTNGSLVNAPGAQINSLPGSGGSRNLTAQYDNQGTITVSANLATSKAGADHLNSGNINVTGGNYTITLSGTTPTFTNTGTLSVATGRALNLNGNISGGTGLHYFHNGGTLGGAGTVSVTNATLHLGLPLTTSFTNLAGNGATFEGPDTLHVVSSSPSLSNCTLNGPVVCSAGTLGLTSCDTNGLLRLLSGSTVEWRVTNTLAGTFDSYPGSTARLLGTVSQNATLTATVPMTNNGVFELSSVGAATAATLSLNGTFTNAAGGTLRSLAGSLGLRQLLCQLDNQGLFEVQQSLTLSRATATHANSGTTRVSATKVLTVSGASFTNTPTGLLAGDGTLTMSGATALAQNGIVSPGASPGRLTFNATNYPCASTSVYNAEVGGETPAASLDQIAISGAAQLAGTLNVSIVNGHQPVPGRRYVIATFASRTGTFGTVNGLEYGPGQAWTVAYSDTDVVLLAMDQTWTRLFATGTPPLARDGHTAVLDSTGDRMIVFGGRSDAGPRNDVWVLTHATSGNGSQWIALSPTGTPPAVRTNSSAVYDAATNRMIVYGGDDAGVTPFGDTWVLTNANGLGGAPAWIALAPASPPPARSAQGTALDHVNNRMILFGGTTTPGSCAGALADTWVLENANGLGGAPVWTSISPTGIPPSARQFHGAAYDAAHARLIVTGGDDGCGASNTESWVLDGANGLSGPAAWTPVAAGMPALSGWSLARYAYDATYQWVDAFGGKLGSAYTDTSFTLTGADGDGGAGWVRRLFWGTRPEARSLHSMVVSGGNHVAVVFGGLTENGRVNDVYRREIDRGRVLAVDPPVTPPVGRPLTTAFAMPPSPNPARGEVALAVDVASDQPVDLGVFDLAGRRVATLHSGMLAAGRHAFRWSGTGDRGPIAPGVYLVRFHARDRDQVVRMVRLK